MNACVSDRKQTVIRNVLGLAARGKTGDTDAAKAVRRQLQVSCQL